MKKAEYPIVVIDEEQDQLEEMTAAFQEAGIGCMPIQYDNMYQDEAYTGVELLFLDVNLNPGGGQADNALYGFLADAITKYISTENGPYVLIFWTTMPDMVDGFKTYVERDKTAAIYNHRPIYVRTLAKDDFVVQPRESIEDIMNKPIVKLIFSLYENLHAAATGVFKDLVGCVPPSERWGDNDTFIQNLKAMFTKIVVTSVGKDNAAAIPDKAICEVLGREIQHHLVKNSKSEWKNFLMISDHDAEQARGITNQEWQYHLNTVFHVEENYVDKTQRGIILTGKKWEFDTLLGKDLHEWYSEEFEIKQTQGDGFMIVPVAMEISPSCDYAQGNRRLYKFLLGLCRISKEKPSNNMELHKAVPFKRRDRHIVLPTFFRNDKYYKMVFSFNHIVGISRLECRKLEYLMLLRNEMVTFVASSAADYCSRIGIVNVNES